MTTTEHDPLVAGLAGQLAMSAAEGPVRVCDVITHLPGADAAGGLSVVAFDEWTPAHMTELGRAATGTRLLPLRASGALTLLGPVIGPGLPGCLDCVEDVWRRGMHQAVHPARTASGGTLSRTMLPALAALVVEVARDPAAAAETVWVLNSSDATVSTHHVPSRVGCPSSHPVPDDDDPAGARFVPAPRPVSPGTLRQANAATADHYMRQALVDPRIGPVVALHLVADIPLPLVSAATVVNGRQEWGHGRGATVAEAQRTAIFEAVERALSVAPRRRRTVLHASYAELGPQRAVDPVTLGLPDPRYHSHAGARLTPYRPDIATRWVYGWSLTGNRALAVPEHVAYYAVPADPAVPRFVSETSNGCGLGNSLEEATLYGLFEVAERDAFLMAWYAQTPLRRVAIPRDDPFLPHITDTLAGLGYELMLFDATNDLGLPVVLSLALRGDGHPTAPHAYFSAGAHADPLAAIRSAALEAAAGLCVYAVNITRNPERGDRDRRMRMLADSTEVRKLDDHVDLYSLPEARRRYDFLLGEDAAVDWQTLWPDRPAPATDLTEVLHGLVARLAGLGLETVVVDQTEAWLRDRLGLYAAKVIVPGTLPMTFGHAFQRTRDLPRLLHVPARLGRAAEVLDLATLALHPHPFP